MNPLPKHVQSAINLAAAGNADTARFLASFYRVSQVFDDLLDRDQAVDKLTAQEALLDWSVVLLLNPFARQHNALLAAGLAQVVMRNVDGDLWAASPDPARRALAPAIRCGDTDFLLLCAWIARGGDTRGTLALSDTLRDYDTPGSRPVVLQAPVGTSNTG